MIPNNAQEDRFAQPCRALRVREESYHEKTRSLGETEAGYNLTKALSLAGDLEDAEILRKLEHRK